MKKFMKGLLATTMVFAMMTSLAGCGGDAATDDGADAKKETLTMATNATFPPYEYYEGQDIVGIDAEIGQALAISWAWISKSRIWNLIPSFLR